MKEVHSQKRVHFDNEVQLCIYDKEDPPSMMIQTTIKPKEKWRFADISAVVILLLFIGGFGFVLYLAFSPMFAGTPAINRNTTDVVDV
jgi:preprotein translocase subunit Sss1